MRRCVAHLRRAIKKPMGSTSGMSFGTETMFVQAFHFDATLKASQLATTTSAFAKKAQKNRKRSRVPSKLPPSFSDTTLSHSLARALLGGGRDIDFVACVNNGLTVKPSKNVTTRPARIGARVESGDMLMSPHV